MQKRYYTACPREKHPGLVIFMIDQSCGLKESSSFDGKTLADLAADFLNCSIEELIRMNIRPMLEDEDDDDIRDSYMIVIISYGGYYNNPIQVINCGYLSKIEEKYERRETNTIDGKFTLLSIIKPIIGYGCPMATAFREAKNIINEWRNDGHNRDIDPSPIICNITAKGSPIYDEGYTIKEAYSNTIQVAQEIMSMQFPDGSPRILNVILTSDKDNEMCFPDEKCILNSNDLLTKFVFDISSEMTDVFEAVFGSGKLIIIGSNPLQKLIKLFWTHMHVGSYSIEHGRFFYTD